MRLRLIRHATLVVEYGGKTFLVDSMLDDPGARPAIQNSPNPRNNPLVLLPLPAQQVGSGVDALLVTHTHSESLGCECKPLAEETTATPVSARR